MSIYDIAAEFDVDLERFNSPGRLPRFHVCTDRGGAIGEIGKLSKEKTQWYASVYDYDGDCRDYKEGLNRQEAIEFVAGWSTRYRDRFVQLPSPDDTISEVWVERLFDAIAKIVSNPTVCKASKDFARLLALAELVGNDRSIEDGCGIVEGEAVCNNLI